MKYIAFNAKCPFEIGDKVALESSNGTKYYRTITDIVFNHFVKSGKIEFRYELNESGNYVLLEVQGKESGKSD